MAAVKFDIDDLLRPLREFENAQRMRAWIINAYAGAEYILTDFVIRAQADLPCSEKWAAVPGDFKGKAARSKDILELLVLTGDGAIIRLLEELLADYETRNVLAHGLCVRPLLETSGQKIVFRKWSRKSGDLPFEVVREFTADDLDRIANELGAVAQSLMSSFQQIYERLGWVESSIFHDRQP